MGGIGGGLRRAALAGAGFVLLAATPALADFGAFSSSSSSQRPNPSESPRVKTPNDPSFDRCEADDEDTATRECTSYWNEQYGLFGFGPDSSSGLPLPATYLDPAQLDQQGRNANLAAGNPPLAQISGVRADTAWKYSVGRPDVSVAILDTGIEWQNEHLVDKVRLNTRELPKPQGSSSYDKNSDGAVSVADYASDTRLKKTAGDKESDEILDGSDLIATFSDGSDADGNGYVDDIAGWDFFDDDNDPFDASSCCSAEGHGSDRAESAVGETNDGKGDASLCPECRLVPLRVWDTFVVDSNLFSMATAYAADNGVSVVEGAVGGLLNSRFARRTFRYADAKGVTLTLVSSDLNTANHNYPTNYNEAIYVGGSLPDTAPNDNCEIPSPPVIGGPDLPGADQCKAFLAALDEASGGNVQPSAQPPTTSFFRNANLTQYGGKADIVLMGSTGSENTGQASGAAGLLQSFGRQRFGSQSRYPKALSGNEIRQLLTMGAEDVRPGNTGQIGLPDKARAGWDPHFGYGRVNLAKSMAMIQAGQIPPEAQLNAPDWFAPINVDRISSAGVPIKAHIAAPHSEGGAGSWTVEYACGQDALDSSFKPVPGASGSGARDGQIGTLSKGLLKSLADSCDGSIANDAGLPAGRPTDVWPLDPYPDPDPHKHAFQIRLTVREAGDSSNIGRYRKTLFAYRDDGLHKGWPKPVGSDSVPADLVTGSGGETAPRLFDMDGDNELDVVLANSSGEVAVLDSAGNPLPSWNGGKPVHTDYYPIANRHRSARGLGRPPREPLRHPTIGDITGDGDAEVVAAAGEHVYAWSRTGKRVKGFPVRIEPSLSSSCKPGVRQPCFEEAQRLINKDNHIKRGLFSSSVLADLDGDGDLEIAAASLDQHLYVWNGRGKRVPGFPMKLASKDAKTGAEIVTTPAVAELDGKRGDELVVSTNEVLDAQFQQPNTLDELFGIFVGAATGSNPVYAVTGKAKLVQGWPARVGVLAGDILPLVMPGLDSAVFDQNGDGKDEVSVAATTGDAKLLGANGKTIRTYGNSVTAGQNSDPTLQLNLVEYPAIGDLAGSGDPAVVKGGLSLGAIANLGAPNQNVPFNHTVQAWDPATGRFLPGFPVATDDFQLLSQPVIAKVDKSGPARQALVGTGLYQLHAYGPTGDEPSGWPKFTGGWMFATPSVGDVDGDGKLDVMTLTREGWSFLWRTSTPACRTSDGTTNSEWWTVHHDEHSSHNYGHDARPPSRPGRLTARGESDGDLRVSFTASGDDMECGKARRYEVVASSRPIKSGATFVKARGLKAREDAGASSVSASTVAAGKTQRLTVERGARYRYVALRAVDDAGNRSFVRQVSTRGKTSASDDDSGGSDGGGGDDGAAGSGAAGTSGGSLPFTGLVLFLLALVGGVLLGTGALARRGAER